MYVCSIKNRDASGLKSRETRYRSALLQETVRSVRWSAAAGGASNKVHTISVIHHRGQIYKQQGVRSAVVWTLLKVEEESLPFSCNRMETTPQPPLDRCLDLGVINKPRSDAQRDNFFSVVQYVVRIGVQPRKCKISSLQRSLSETFAAVV